MKQTCLNYKIAIFLLVLTPIFFWSSHYLAVFPHEYSHALIASLFGYKQHFWQIDYGGKNFWNIVFLIHINENVNYAAIYADHKNWLVALIAFAGIGFGNLGTYLVSLWLLAKKSIISKPWLCYFCFWWHVNSIGNFIDYIPSRTFTTHGDIANITQALNISPWWIMITMGYPIFWVLRHFYTQTLVKTYAKLNISNKLWHQRYILIWVTGILFCLYGAVGINGYGLISQFVSLLSVWLSLPILVLNWPRRTIK